MENLKCIKVVTDEDLYVTKFVIHRDKNILEYYYKLFK